MKKGHFRLTCVAQKRCCLSSLFSNLLSPQKTLKQRLGASLGKERKRGFSLLPSSPPRLLFSIICFFIGIPSESLFGGESLKANLPPKREWVSPIQISKCQDHNNYDKDFIIYNLRIDSKRFVIRKSTFFQYVILLRKCIYRFGAQFTYTDC